MSVIFSDKARKKLQNKVIDGGIADNEHKVIVPANTTANLTAIERSPGAIYYDTTASGLVFDNGSSLVTIDADGSAVQSFNGRTGVVVPASGDYTKAQVGLSNVDNTSDANKPVSTAQQAAIDLKVPSQTGHSGEFLTTNGSATSWAAVAGSSDLQSSYDAGNTIVTSGGDNVEISGTEGLVIARTSGTNPTLFINSGGGFNQMNSNATSQTLQIFNADTGGVLGLYDVAGTHTLTVKSPAVMSSSMTWTLPTAQGAADTVLSNNGSGVLSWEAAGAGANAALSNLASTSINEELEFQDYSGTPSGGEQVIIRGPSKADTTDGTAVIITSGDVNDDGATVAALVLQTGKTPSGDLGGANIVIRAANIVPASGVSPSLGQSGSEFTNLYLNGTIRTSSNSRVIEVGSRQLKSPGNVTALDWSGSDISVNTRKITNVVDPSSAQDVATKNYVDSAGSGANTTLSNLTSPTAINEGLIFAANSSISTPDTTGATASLTLSMFTGDTVTGAAGNISMIGGTSSGGQGGNIQVSAGDGISKGTVSVIGFESGAIKLQDTSEGTSGQVWTSTDIDGSGTWMPASGGGVTTAAAIGSSPNANAMTISGANINLQPASASFGGVVTTGTQTFEGTKTFGLTGGGNTGDFNAVTSGNSYITVTAGTGIAIVGVVRNGAGTLGMLSNNDFTLRTNNVDQATLSTAGALRLHSYTTAGVLVNDTSGNLTSKQPYASSAAPASASASGVAGQIAYDATFFYVCVATNTWVRAALTTW